MSVWHVASEWRVISEWHVMSVRHAFGHHRSSLGPQAWMIYKHFMARPDLRRFLRTGSDVSDVPYNVPHAASAAGALASLR